jgi:Domain of unknown function (DUF4386)
VSPDQIAEERRRGRFAGVAAIAAALVFAAGELWSQSVNSDAPKGNRPAGLRFLDRHSSELIAASALRALALLLLVVATVHLYRAIKARNPDESGVVLVMGVYGPLAWAIGTVVVAVVLAISASHFVARRFQTIDAAEDAFRTAQLIGLLAFSGLLALAFWLVKGCLDAMRVGLLSRFMGIIGVVIGPALVVTPFGSVLLPVWLLALGALFCGLWPRGAPPAWESGQAMPWPSSRERLEAAGEGAGLGGDRNGEVEAVGPGVQAPGPETQPAASAGGARRKRKRRR